MWASTGLFEQEEKPADSSAHGAHVLLNCLCYIKLARAIHTYIYLYIYNVHTTIWQGNHHIYSHIRCIYPFLAKPMYIRSFWQGNHHIYGHIRCQYTVLAHPIPYLCMESYVPLVHKKLAFENLSIGWQNLASGLYCFDVSTSYVCPANWIT
jgi:hypothetical protein